MDLCTAWLVLLAVAGSEDPQRHFREGLALHDQGRPADAVAAFERARGLGMKAPALGWRMARSLAKAGRTKEALAALEEAAGLGFAAVAQVEEDQDLVPVRALPGWPAVRERLDRNMRPCAYDPVFRAFDFWVGEWVVTAATAPPGTPPGHSRIELVDDQCVVQETYTTPLGFTGRSLNLYDRETKRWEQFWVDNKGGKHHYIGEARDGNLYYLAENVRLGPPSAPLSRVRMTFFPQGPDQVRQLMEQSTDGGTTWTTAFDGTYRRRQPAGPLP